MAATVTWFTIDDSTLVSLLVKRLEKTTDTRISYQDGATITRTWAPTLSVKGLVIGDSEGHLHIESHSLTLQINLPSLLIGKLDMPRLWIGASRIDITTADTESRVDLELPILQLQPTLHDVRISESAILLDGDTYRLPETRSSELSLRKSDRGIPELSTRIEVGSEIFDIKAVLPITDETQTPQQLPFSIFVKGDIVDASIVGQVDLKQSTPVVTAAIDADLSDLEQILTYTELDIPGSLKTRAQLTGPVNKVALEDLSASWSGPGQSRLKLNGRIGDAIAIKDIELSLAGQLDEAGWLSPFLPETIGSLSTAEVSVQLAGDRSRVDVRQFDLKANTSDNLELSLSGELDLVQIFADPQLENSDLKLAFTATTTRAARALLFDTIPELGAITGKADVRAEKGAPAIENIVIHTRDEKGIEADLSGRINRFPLDPDKPNSGYDLDVSMQASETSVMTERLGLDLPFAGPLALKYRIEGDTQALQLNKINLSAGKKKESLITVKGQLLFREWERADPLKTVDLVFDMRARDAGLLNAFTTQEFPPLAYRAHARVHTVSGQHRIDDFRLTSLEGEPLQISETGSADRVIFLPKFGLEGIHIDSSVRMDDIAKLNSRFKLDYMIPAVGPLDWHATVTGTDTKLLIDNVSLTTGREPVFRLEAKGRLGYISAAKKWQLEDTDLELTASSASSQALVSTLGYHIPELGPMQAHASINDEGKTLGIHSFKMMIGESGNPVLSSTGAIGDLYAFKKIEFDTKLHLGGQEFANFADKHELPDLGSVSGTMLVSDKDGSPGIDSLHIESSRKEVFSLYVDGRFGDFNKPDTLVLTTRLTARDMKLVGALLDRDWPDHGLVEFHGEVKQPGKETLFNATLTSGKEKIEIGLRGDFDTSPPTVKGQIKAQNFFLPNLVERAREKRAEREKEKEEKQKAAATKAPVFSTTPLDLEWLKAFNMDLSVTIESFDRELSEAESATLALTLTPGQLSIYPATLAYPQGEARLKLELVADDQLKAEFLLVGENLNPWKGLNIEKAGAEGIYETGHAKADVNISLNSSGNSPHELASNLQGDLYFAITEGKISQSLTRLLFVDIVGWVADHKKERYDNVNCAIADYSIDNGVMMTDTFFMDTDRITIAGEGTIDLGSEQIDYVFIPRKKSRLIAKAEPVKIQGPLNDPSVSAIPVKSIAATAGKMGTLLFAPYVLAGVVAGEFTAGTMSKKGGKEDTSACREYVEKETQDRKENNAEQ